MKERHYREALNAAREGCLWEVLSAAKKSVPERRFGSEQFLDQDMPGRAAVFFTGFCDPVALRENASQAAFVIRMDGAAQITEAWRTSSLM